ncbi:MAG: FtsQ-type POTRA domain-containing protein [Candidatus Portnoybacteria bacterium]|nr:FtsQ-type POTRA domain-containing protein [Candidatus Portnoybacteria bacterium]
MKKRKTKKGTRIRRAFFLILFFFLILGYIFFLSPLFNIKSIAVTGNKEIKESQVQESIKTKNIFLATNNKIEKQIREKLFKVYDISIEKDLIKRTIRINIKEREREAIVCHIEKEDQDCFYIDQKGIIFEEAPQTSGSLIILIEDYSEKEFNLGEKTYKEETIESIIKIKEYLSKEIGLKTQKFEKIETSTLKALTSEGWYVMFNLEKDILKQLLSLKAALETKISDQERESLEYIDLRIENRIYYK